MISNGYTSFLSNVIEHTNLKANVIANNLSNTNTPNFKAQEVKFSEVLNKALKTSVKTDSERHINKSDTSKFLTSEVVTTSNGKVRYDGNNVDQTKEVIEMIKNANAQNLTINAINSEFDLLRTAMGN